jgi:hypothetical protein
MPALSSNTLVVRSDAVIDANVDNEVVALHIENGTCYGLNSVGSRIWSLLNSRVRIGDLCAVLLTEYDIDPMICERQVLDLLDELRSEGLISTCEEGSVATNPFGSRP